MLDTTTTPRELPVGPSPGLTIAPTRLIETLAQTAAAHHADGRSPGEAVDEALTHQTQQLPDTHADRLYLTTYLHHHYGFDEAAVLHASGAPHATTWDDITNGLATTLAAVLQNILQGHTRPTAITPDATLTQTPNGLEFAFEFSDVVSWGSHPNNIQKRHYRDLPRGLPLSTSDVDAYLTHCTRDLTGRLPDSPTENGLATALHAIMDDTYQAIRETGPTVAGSLLDAYHDLHGHTGAESIESEQLTEAATEGWEATVKTGVLWHATHHAIRAHYDQSQIG